MTKSKICLACPRSCNLRPQLDALPGQKLCPQGKAFLQQETLEPKRHYFATVRSNDGKIYSYRTLEPVSMQTITRMCENLKRAASPQQRNKLHQQFCEMHKVRLTCIDTETN